ncbi:hypothetical protein BKD09_38385 [Bradyrhizobium japonicum]|uniref:Uncharacterized protein n=1 Tax=Bradyrhizobium japonicum TaxID=375 RepID=A0A1L3FLU3_BRAJP|nr:hypothetical protein BKD09_38385 [Bradyrhizobium japonicum]
MTHLPAAVAAAPCAQEVSTAVPCGQEATAGARSRRVDIGAVLSPCAAGVTAIGALMQGIADIVTASVRRQWGPRRSAQLRRGPTTAAAAAMTLTETMFARAGTLRTERSDVVGPWCSKRWRNRLL